MCSFLLNVKESQELTIHAQQELTELYTVLTVMLDDALLCFTTGDKNVAKRVVKNEDLVDELEEVFRYRYMERLSGNYVVMDLC